MRRTASHRDTAPSAFARAFAVIKTIRPAEAGLLLLVALTFVFDVVAFAIIVEASR